MENLIGFARFIVYDTDDIAMIHIMANDSYEEYNKRMDKEGKERNEEDMKQEFKGYLSKYTKENELKAWKLISSACDELLSKYPTTL